MEVGAWQEALVSASFHRLGQLGQQLVSFLSFKDVLRPRLTPKKEASGLIQVSPKAHVAELQRMCSGCVEWVGA